MDIDGDRGVAEKQMNIMNIEQFEALCAHLDERLENQECDSALTIASEWLESSQFDTEENLEQIRNLGGYCDCEVLFNAAGRWPDCMLNAKTNGSNSPAAGESGAK